jgi:hypothetical protein
MIDAAAMLRIASDGHHVDGADALAGVYQRSHTNAIDTSVYRMTSMLRVFIYLAHRMQFLA